MKNYNIYLDGQWMKYHEANLPILTHTLHYGVGVFEGVRVYETKNGPAIFRLQDHTARLLRSAAILNLDIPCSAKTLNAVQQEVIQRNHLCDAYIRPLIFVGEGGMGLSHKAAPVRLLVAAWPWQNFHHQHKENGLQLMTVSYARQSGSPELLKAKAIGHYLTSAMAIDEAKQKGGDEALLLDPEGFVCEASGQNIFMIKNNALITSASRFALDGVTKNSILKLAQDLKIPTEEKLFTLEELYQADAAFLTGTASEIVPIKTIDKHLLNSATHPMVQTLMQTFSDIVHGERPEYHAWLTYVDGEL